MANEINVIPAELRSRTQWVLWKYVEKDGKQTKVPFSMRGYGASSTKAKDWCAFATAYSGRKDYAGIGYILAADDPYTGIDLDGCIDANGTLAPWAVEIVDRLANVAYGEISPSGTGIKFLLRGEKTAKKCVYAIPADQRTDTEGKQQIECYEKSRFWTITGNVFGDAYKEIGDGQDALNWLCQKYLASSHKAKPKASPSSSSSNVLGRASKYLAKMPPAIQGSGGSVACLKAASAMVKGFALSEDDAFNLLATEYNDRCDPPWSDHELRHKIESAANNDSETGYLLGSRAVDDFAPQCYETEFLIAENSGRTDAANAHRFVEMFSSEVLHVPKWSKWLAWDGSRWAEDCGVGTMQRAKWYANSLWKTLAVAAPGLDRDEFAAVAGFVKSSNQTAKINSFLKLAAVDERVVCPVEELNADPTLLNCVNGTVDLVTGLLRPHSPADRITQICNVAYDENTECPRWLETLNLIFDGDQELISYVQRLLGYSLSGDTGEHILPIAYGSGNNGKSTIWNTITDLLGEYATLANDELLLGDKSNHPTEKAALYQKRFVAISEPEKNSKLRESRVKELTGDRMITARRMHEDFWTFERTHTFWLSTNHLPRIDGTDLGIWRRVKLIPFAVNLKDKVRPIADFDKWLVKHEGRGILAWLVRGYLDYRQHGLQEPEAVTKATDDYRDDSDALGEFLSEYVVEEKGAEVLASDLFSVYSETFHGKWSQTTFGKNIAERYAKTKSRRVPNRGKTIYFGIRLRSAKDDENDEEVPDGTSHNSPPRNATHIQDQCFNWNHQVPEPKNTAPPPGKHPCPRCGAQLIPAVVIDGYRNWDCPTCHHVEAKRVKEVAS